MRAFHFSLEKILELKAYREQEAEIELGRAIGALSEIEGRIKTAVENRYRAAAERFAPGNSGRQMLKYENYISRLDQERDRLLEEAAQAELLVEEKRALYLEAARERKVLDKLKEKREKEYRKKMFAEETKTLDDISGGTSARARMSGGS
ncbi:MAG: flagellar export protein FliJ [Treponema sp.]|jgi:flagellar FliJ protein|nr:flagellar export protein FliJ [Treponema sp.]